MRPIFRGRTLTASLQRWIPIALDETKLVFTVNSVDRSLYYDRDTLQVLDDLNELPNTLSFECFGFTPAHAQVVRLMIGTTKEFEGTITNIAEYHDKLSARTVYRVSCVDYTRTFDALLVTKAYGSQSATATAQDIVTNFTSGFTQVKIAAALPTVAAIQFKMTKPSSALRQLCDAFGGDCYVDYDKDTHVFVTETDVVPDTVSATTTNWRAFKYTSMIERVANRIFVEGAGTTTVLPAAISATTLTIMDRTVFPASGSLITGNQILAYTGMTSASTAATLSSTAAAKTTPPAPTGTLGGGGAAATQGAYSFAWTYIDGNGVESAKGSAQAFDTTGNANPSFTATAPSMPSGATVRLYMTTVNTSNYFLVSPTGAFAMGSSLSISFQNNGVTSPPATSNYAAGSTSINVADTSKFTSGIGVSGSSTFKYSGKSTASGAGALTGIPASGTGATTSTIAVGDTITDGSGAVGASTLNVADTSVFNSNTATSGSNTFTYSGKSTASGAGTLTGIPASGSGSITVAIASGATVTDGTSAILTGVTGVVNAIAAGADINLLVQRDDATSQATYGIRQDYIQDRRLSLTGAQARGDAELALRKDPYISGSFITTDTKVRSGRRVTISLSSEWGISGTYTISKVRVFWEKDRPLPQREVTFSSNSGDNDLFRILRRIREQQQQQTAA